MPVAFRMVFVRGRGVLLVGAVVVAGCGGEPPVTPETEPRPTVLDEAKAKVERVCGVRRFRSAIARRRCEIAELERGYACVTPCGFSIARSH